MSEEQAAKRPSHLAYQVREGEEGKAYFNRIGAAFAHKDGQGFNIMLDAVPVDGRVTLRTVRERLDAMREGTPQKEGKEVKAERDDQGHAA